MQDLILCCALLVASAAALIPREKLISDSAFFQPTLSTDGTIVMVIAPDTNKTRNVFTMRLADRQKRQVTFETRDVVFFQWTGVKDIIIYGQDNYGDENLMLFKKNISEKASKDKPTVISRKKGVRAEIFGNDRKSRYIYVAMNDVTPQYHNVYKFDLITNKLSLIFDNKRFSSDSIYTDNNMNIRLASEQQNDGSVVYFRVADKANSSMLTSDADQWEEYLRVKPDDAPITSFGSFDETNTNVYWTWGADTDLGSLVVAPFSNFSRRVVLYKCARGELQDFLFHPDDNTLLAFTENYHKPELVIYNKTVAEPLGFLTRRRPTDSLNIISMSHNMDTWLVTYVSSERPNEIFVYNRSSSTLDRLFNLNRELEGYTLNKQIGFDFAARDGLKIQAYLSLPLEATLKKSAKVPKKDRKLADLGMIPAKPQKMVLLVHGGPQSRDMYGYDSEVAHLTSRGYAVMQVNFRGSTGFGKKLTNAGNGEWSRKMHTDLLDAVDFAVERKITNRSAVAIMGTSYGGYSALTGLTFTPDVFACGVDIVGPANLITIIETIPPYWTGVRRSLVKMVGGDPATDEGRKELIARSPFFIADRVKKPLMIMQGGNDPRVKQQESDQFVAALRNDSIPVTYVLYPDEGHGFRRIPNRLAQFGFVERFLHNCLGGEYQPFMNGQYNESAIVKSDGFASQYSSTVN